MTLPDLFVVRDPQSATGGAGVFTAPQSLSAFPVATSVVASVSRAVRTTGITDADSTVVALAVSIVVSIAIFAVTVSDAAARPRNGADWALSAMVAASNCLLLYVAALGIEKF